MEIQRLDIISAEELNQLAKDNAEKFVNQDRLKTHQLRNVFSSIEKMRTSYKAIIRMKKGEKKEAAMGALKRDLILIKPKIAYAAGRQRSVRNNFFPFVEAAIDAVKRADYVLEAYKNFFALMESVVGYHKFYETA